MSKILLRRTNTPGKIPTTSDVDIGELALNTYDGRAFFKSNQGAADTMVELSISGHGHAIADTSGLQAALDGKQASLGFTAENSANKGQANGYASLGSDGKVPATQLPSYVDDVVEAVNLAAFPLTGETGKIYLALDTNKSYRWSGSAYVYITSGAVDSVGGFTGVVTKTQLGINNVDNTSDVNKPVSTAQAAADTAVQTAAATDATTKANAAQAAAQAAAATDATTKANAAQAAAIAASAPIAHVGSGGTSHAVAVAGASAGFMSAADKTKLDGIASGATNFSLPTASASTLGGVKVGSGLSIDGSGVLTAAGATNLAQGTNTATTAVITSSTGTSATLTAATSSLAGVLTAADKAKLDAITGTNTGDQTTITGNAGTATTLQTARTINGVSFNGSANITVTAAADTLTGTTLATNVVSSSLTSLGTLVDLTSTGNLFVTNDTGGLIAGTAPGYSAVFNGTNSWLTTPSSTQFNLTTGDFTVEAFVKPTSYVNTGGIISQLSAATGWAMTLDTSGTGKLLVNGNIGGWAGLSLQGATPLTLNAWNHVAFVRSGNTFYLFLHGTQQASTVNAGNLGTVTNGPIAIGSASNTAWQSGWAGNISNVRIVKTALYTSAFTPSTLPLTAIANTRLLTVQSTPITDVSVNAFTISNTGTVTTATNSPFGGGGQASLLNDGAGNWVSNVNISAPNLSNVNNTSDANKPVSTAQAAAIALKVAKAGDSLTGSLAFNGTSTVTGLAAPTLASDAATKSYVDNLLSGLSWKDAVETIGASNPATATTGERFLNTTTGKIHTATATNTWDAGVVPTDGDSVFNRADETGYVYSGTAWTQFTGTGQVAAGIGLVKNGNQLDINLGSGIQQLPSDEVGIDLYSTGGLFLTEDGTTSSGASAAKVSLLLDGTTLSKSATGVRVAASVITELSTATSNIATHVGSGGASHANAVASGAAGFMSGADKSKLDGIAAGAQVNVATNLGQGTLTATTVPLTSSTGTGTTLPAATASVAGVMAAADKSKLDGIAAGAQVNVATNIAEGTRTTTNVPITSSTGTGATLSAATSLLAGVMLAADKAKLDGIASGATANTGTVTSVAMTVPAALTVAGSPITTSGTLAVTMTAGYAIPTTASQTNWDTAYTDRNKWDGGATGLVAATGRTSLGATTIGGNMFTLVNPTAITFPRFNADNTVSALDAATFRTAIGAGTSSTTGTVTTASVVSANGFAGTVATAGTTPAITISTSVTGLLKGNGTAVSAAVQADVTGLLGAGSITNAMLANGAVANLSGTNTGDQTNITGNAGTATTLQTARTIGGVSFNGSANINLPGVNAPGNQSTSGDAGSVNSPDGDRLSSTKLPTTSPNRVRFDFVGGAQVGSPGSNYAGLMTYAPWSGTTASTGDASYQLAFAGTAADGAGLPVLKLRKGIDSTWNSWYDVLTSATGVSIANGGTGASTAAAARTNLGIDVVRVVSSSAMSIDVTDYGASAGQAFSMIDCTDFSATVDGSIWFNLQWNPAWSTSSNLLFDIYFSLDTTDAAKGVVWETSVWAITAGDTPVLGTPSRSATDTLTSGTTNTNKVALTTLTNGYVPTASLAVGDIIAVKMKRIATNVGDTYTGKMQLIQVIARQ